MKKKSSSRYQQLVAAFATSAFALLGMLSMQQHDANVTTAAAVDHATVMTTYRSTGNCIAVKGTRVVQNNYRVCRSR
jgi:hypothetical protein